MNAQQLTELRHDEGTRLLVYDDATGKPLLPGDTLKGHPTIGTGRALDVNGITTDEADQLLVNDLAKIEGQLGPLLWFDALNDTRKGVMVNLAFNMGVRGLQSFVRMIAACQAGDFDKAAHELQDSQWFKQVQTTRSTRLVRQLRTGQL
jgi:lysozyme